MKFLTSRSKLAWTHQDQELTIPLLHFDKEAYHAFMLENKYFSFMNDSSRTIDHNLQELYDYIFKLAVIYSCPGQYFAFDVLLPDAPYVRVDREIKNANKNTMQKLVHIEDDIVYTVMCYAPGAYPDATQDVLTDEQKTQLAVLAFKKINASPKKLMGSNDLEMYCGELNYTPEDMNPKLHVSTAEYDDSHFGIYGLAFDAYDEYHAVFYESVHFMGGDDLIKDVFENGTGFELSLKYCGYPSSDCCKFFFNSVSSSFSTKFFDGFELKDVSMDAGPTSIHAEENSDNGDQEKVDNGDGNCDIQELIDGYSIVFQNIFFYRIWLHKVSVATKQIPIHMVPCTLYHHNKKCLMSDPHHADDAGKFRLIIDEFIAQQDANLRDYTLVVRPVRDLDFSKSEQLEFFRAQFPLMKVEISKVPLSVE